MADDLDPDDRALARFLEEHDGEIPENVPSQQAQRLVTLQQLDQLVAEERDGLVPHQLNEYRLIRRLGRGGMGTVYLAQDDSDQRLVALKVIERSLTHSRSTVRRFASEARLGQRLRHPNLVTIYGDGSDSHYAYFAMEFVPGISLGRAIALVRARRKAGAKHIDLHELVTNEIDATHSDCLEPGELNDKQESRQETYYAAVARIIAEVADALAYLHEAGVIHRDVKPENILLDRRVSPHLSDLGLAKDRWLASNTRSGALLGTIEYMSPELAEQGGKAVSNSTDIYSLGVTLYELLTLRLPHNARSSHEALRRIGVEIPPLPRTFDPDVPRDLEAIVIKAIEPRPENRYAEAAQMAEDLRRFLRFDPIKVRPPGPGRALARFVQSHRRASLATALAILALGIWSLSSRQALAKERHDLLTEARELRKNGRLAEMEPIVRRLRATGSSDEIDAMLRLSVGTVQVEFSSQPDGALVTAQRLDHPAGAHGSVTTLGRTATGDTPLTAWLDAGTYRITMHKESFGSGEFLLHVPWQDRATVLATQLRSDHEVLQNMIAVPAGEYVVGYDPPNARGTAFDLEERRIDSPGFLIDEREVSNADYAEFVAATGAVAPWLGDELPAEIADLPVTNVSWFDANAYAEWVGKRLPTELEWEIAARGTQGTLYPWGDRFEPHDAHLGPASHRAGEDDPVERRVRASSKASVYTTNGDVSAFGVKHLTGNVREWTFDTWIPRSGVLPTEQWLHANGQRAVRGASYLLARSAAMSRSSFRTPLAPTERRRDLGFRCAKSSF